ncbi:sigma E protease regulator RseP [Alteromonas lipolytica]|uniref:Zinc metalloprotease n=1 Tax=Alteromonas lipolytica TaxID=1856405 RepID=A0A1E8FEQ0_9ALTE|nr:sigma E protease regulator RseP [Alteromonas lipolytica]OFI34236.1 RIP metalloprotease RseP [Alteromonas lipolytica]GGF83859.1 putative zinc metalloprotease [Alteromonas lipolytica]
MFEFLRNAGAFIIALGILVAVHEWGHYYVARLCGVHVRRFSIGFGKPIWSKVDKHGTEFALAAIPLGGYVRMLDERIDEVPPEMASQAFNTQSVGKRMAIIAAGPGVNFVFAAIALYAMFLIGITTIKPVIGEVSADSIAAQSGLSANMEIVAVGSRQTEDWEAVNLELMSYIGQEAMPVTVASAEDSPQQRILDISQWNFDPDSESPLQSLGITPFRPKATLTVAYVAENSAASQAGLQQDDKILALDGQTVSAWEDLVAEIKNRPGDEVVIKVNRAGQTYDLSATIGRRDTPEGQDGYLGVSPFAEAWPQGYVFTHQYGLFDAMGKAVDKTWRLMTISVEMIGKLIGGDVSVKNLSGPIAIAQGAGNSAGYGLVYFLSFLALISVNLGIVNLLPLPMLDGGHLMYFTIEWITGRPVPEEVQEWGFRIGAMLLFTIMSIAIFNDITRLS